VKHSAALVVLAAAALLALGSACGGGDGGNDSAAPKATTTTRAEPPPATTADESSRCKKVPPGLVKAIESGLTVTGGGKLTNAWAVKSEDFKRVYFISADIDGTGLEGPDDIGTWAKSGPLRVGGGLILSVDSVANEFSDWGDGRKTDAQLSISDDGAEESQDCVQDAG
jgi:hypothetical protein